jgi:7-cyano-7-deazaguanine synthase in queuosine biosynthesis
MEIQKALDELKALKIDYNLDLGVDFEKAQSEINQALQLQQGGVSGSFSYQEALKFLEMNTPIAVKPVKKSKYKFVDPFTSVNARNIVIFSLATELSKNNR